MDPSAVVGVGMVVVVESMVEWMELVCSEGIPIPAVAGPVAEGLVLMMCGMVVVEGKGYRRSVECTEEEEKGREIKKFFLCWAQGAAECAFFFFFFFFFFLFWGGGRWWLCIK